jgi:uncharacterized protein YbcI
LYFFEPDFFVDRTWQGGLMTEIQLAESPADGAVGVPDRSDLRATVSRELVRFYKERFGRGPTRARTDFAGPDCLVCTLEEVLTAGEHTLARAGEHRPLREHRSLMREVTNEEVEQLVARLVGRPVRRSMTAMCIEDDAMTEVFYFDP